MELFLCNSLKACYQYVMCHLNLFRTLQVMLRTRQMHYKGMFCTHIYEYANNYTSTRETVMVYPSYHTLALNIILKCMELLLNLLNTLQQINV